MDPLVLTIEASVQACRMISNPPIHPNKMLSVSASPDERARARSLRENMG